MGVSCLDIVGQRFVVMPGPPPRPVRGIQILGLNLKSASRTSHHRYYENVTFVETTTGSGTVAIARTVNGQDWGCMSWNTDNYNVTWVRCDPKTNVKGATPLDVYCNKEHSSSDVNWCLFSPNGSPAGSKSCLAEGTADFVKIDAHLPSVTCNAQDPETWYVWRIGKSSSC